MLERGMPLLFPYSSSCFFHSGSFVTATTLRPAWDVWTLPSFLTHGRGEHTEPCTAGLGVLWSVRCYRGSQWLLPIRQASGIFLSESEVRKSWEDNTWGKVAGCEQLWTPVRHQPLCCALSPHGFAWFVFAHAWNSLLRISLFLSQTHTHTHPLCLPPSLHSASLLPKPLTFLLHRSVHRSTSLIRPCCESCRPLLSRGDSSATTYIGCFQMDCLEILYVSFNILQLEQCKGKRGKI